MRRLYQADWVLFEAWCDAAGRTALPAEAVTLAAFLTEAAATLGTGALTRRLSAVAADRQGPSPAMTPSNVMPPIPA
jgi:hypothetical protein